MLKIYYAKRKTALAVYIFRKFEAMVKKMVRVNASKMVLISGPAIMAGSNRIFLATIGSIPPTILAKTTVHKRLKQTTKAIK